jgi:hypothetical protein
MLGGFLGGLSNLGQVYGGYEDQQIRSLKQQQMLEQLRSLQTQRQAMADLGKLGPNMFGAAQPIPPAPNPIASPQQPQQPPPYQPGQVTRTDLAPPGGSTGGQFGGPLGLGGLPGMGPLGGGLPGMGGGYPATPPTPPAPPTMTAGMQPNSPLAMGWPAPSSMPTAGGAPGSGLGFGGIPGGPTSPFGYAGMGGGAGGPSGAAPTQTAGAGLGPGWDTTANMFATQSSGGFDYRQAPGMIVSGTIADPYNRAVLQNQDGSYSTTSSMSIGTDRGEVLIPTVVNGQRLSPEQAKQHYRQTGEHLGIFDNARDADAFATQLHNAQAARLGPHGEPGGGGGPDELLRPMPRPPQLAGIPSGFGPPRVPGTADTGGTAQVPGTADPGVPAGLPAVQNKIFGIESNYGRAPDTMTPNRAGAVGPMQVVPKDYPQYDAERLRTDYNYNLQAGNEIVGGLYRKYNGNADLVAIAYNAGEPRADAVRDGRMSVDQLPGETRAYLDKMHGGSGVGPAYADMNRSASPQEHGMGSRVTQALLAAYPQMPKAVSMMETGRQVAQMIQQGLPGESDEVKGAVFLKLFPMMSEVAKADSAQQWEQYYAEVKKLDFGEKTRHEIAEEDISRGKTIAERFGVPENYTITMPDGTKQTVLARTETSRTGQLNLVDARGNPIDIPPGAQIRRTGTAETGTGIEQGKSYQYTDAQGVQQTVFLREKRGSAGYLDAQTGKDWTPPPGSKNFHEVTSAGAGALAPEVEFPESWEGMPNKPPPGVRQDIWAATLEYTQTGQMPSLGFQPGVRPQIVALQPAAAHALGIPLSELSGAHAEYRGLGAAQTQLGRRLVLLDTGINETAKSAPAVISTSTGVPRSEFPALNNFTNWLRQQSGDPKIVQFRAALQTFLNEYAKAINPSGVLSDTQQRHAYDVLSTSFNQGQIEAGIKQLQAELGYAKEGLTQASQEVGGYFPRVSGQQPQPGGAAAPPPSTGGHAVEEIIERGGKRYRVTGGDPNDPDVEEVQ